MQSYGRELTVMMVVRRTVMVMPAVPVPANDAGTNGERNNEHSGDGFYQLHYAEE